MRAYLNRNEIPSFRFSYEELAQRPAETLELICRFLGVPVDRGMVQLDTSGSHSILGNRMRDQPDKRREVTYDSHWRDRTDWRLPRRLCPRIMRYNRREVYANGLLPPIADPIKNDRGGPSSNPPR